MKHLLLALALLTGIVASGCTTWKPHIDLPPIYVTVEETSDLEVQVMDRNTGGPFIRRDEHGYELEGAVVRVSQNDFQGVTNAQGIVKLLVPRNAAWVEVVVKWHNRCGDPFSYYSWPRLERFTTRHVVWVDSGCWR